MSLFNSTTGFGTSPTIHGPLSSSPDPLANFFTSAGKDGGDWDWSNHLIELPPPSPTASLSPDTPALSPVPPSLSPTMPSLSPVPPSLSPGTTESTPSASQPSPEGGNNPPPTRKRRKREINLSPEMYNIGFEWSPYNSPSSCFQIYDSNSLQLITQQFDIVTHKVESNTHFSAQDNAWICYRQNQFKVVSFLKCPQPQPNMSISDSGVLKEIHQLCVRLYAIKELSTLVADEVRVGIHHVGRARVKKEKQEISMTPFINGRAEFANVQFEKSNSVKGQQLEYFRLVMAFYAKAGNSYFHIFSKQSPRLIVRSQNPGFYGDTTYNYYGSMGIVPAGVVPDASMKTGRVGGVTGGVGVSTPIVANESGGDVKSVDDIVNAIGQSLGEIPGGGSVGAVGGAGGVGETPSGDGETSGKSGIKRGPENDYNDTSYQVPTMYTTTTTTTAAYELPPEPMNFDASAEISTETDFLLASGGWQRRGDSMVTKGNVGINVSAPSEALTVRGNVLVHGDVYKPSDRRIKSDITPVKSSEQLGNIRELKIYDYTVNSKKERGVLAQELQIVMPNAVRPVGDVVMDSKVIPNLLTVNERLLLYENIGATQQLDKEVETGRQTILDINTRVEDLAYTTKTQNANVQGKFTTMIALFFQEEGKKGTHNGLEEEYVSFGFSLFRMGPARTFLVLGHFIPWIWIIGSCYLFSNLIRRKILGGICFLLYSIFLTLTIMDYFQYNPKGYNTGTILMRIRLAWVAIGLLLLFVNYIRLRRKLMAIQKEKNKYQPNKNKFKFTGPKVM